MRWVLIISALFSIIGCNKIAETTNSQSPSGTAQSSPVSSTPNGSGNFCAATSNPVALDSAYQADGVCCVASAVTLEGNLVSRCLNAEEKEQTPKGDTFFSVPSNSAFNVQRLAWPETLTIPVDESNKYQLADMNGDHLMDLVTTARDAEGDSQKNRVAVFLAKQGSQGQSFLKPFTIDLPRSSADDTMTAVVTGDFDCDGKKDIAVADKAAKTIDFIYNAGDSCFSATIKTLELTAPPTLLQAVDTDRDGCDDLLIATKPSDKVPEGVANLLLYKGKLGELPVLAGEVHVGGPIVTATSTIHEVTTNISRMTTCPFPDSNHLALAIEFHLESYETWVKILDISGGAILSLGPYYSVTEFDGTTVKSEGAVRNDVDNESLLFKDLNGDGVCDLAWTQVVGGAFYAGGYPGGTESTLDFATRVGVWTNGLGPLGFAAGAVLFGRDHYDPQFFRGTFKDYSTYLYSEKNVAADFNGDTSPDLAMFHSDVDRPSAINIYYEKKGGDKSLNLIDSYEYLCSYRSSDTATATDKPLGGNRLIATDMDGDGQQDLVFLRKGGLIVLTRKCLTGTICTH